ncbi:aldehyde dehydrogenase [Dietzia sp. B19]|uniref:aldehyde dehydrogenase n=1 Tax=Dietzia sp. B19 TaxID=1630632 RepID=UPI00322091A7
MEHVLVFYLSEVSVVVVHDKLFSGTRWTDPITTGVLEVTSPATNAVVGRVAESTTEDVDEMVSQARDSFESGVWRLTPPAERGALIGRVADMLEERQGEVCQILSDEMGTPPGTAAMIQVTPTLGVLRYYAKLAADFPWSEVRHGDYGASVVTRQPVGVVAAVTAWNVPLYLNSAKLGPALLSGSSVVLKPSSATPLSALWLADLFREAGLPEGVLSVVTGPSSVGDHLVSHPEVDKISFTGSTGVGKHIAGIAAQNLTRCSLELGGKSAAIILEDADIAANAGTMVFSALMNSGQACVSQNRILAPRSRYDEVVEALVENVKAMPVGDPSAEGTAFGPLANHKQKDSVEGYIRKGVEEGATIAYGGGKVEGLPAGVAEGAFVQPTVFTDVDNSMTIAQEEIFGPVLQVIAYDTVDEAVRIANDSEFGLAGAVYSADPDAALAVAQRVRTGTMGINWYAFDPSAPFGGFKNSGLGRENGPEGLDAYCELQSVLMPFGWEAPAG